MLFPVRTLCLSGARNSFAHQSPAGYKVSVPGILNSILGCRTAKVSRIQNRDFFEFTHMNEKYSVIWLRDHCQCELCRHPITKQRLVTDSKLLSGAQVVNIKTLDGSSATQKTVFVKWSDGHESTFSSNWLFENARFHVNDKVKLSKYRVPVKRVYWGKEIAKKPPSGDYNQIMSSDESLLEWMLKIETYGFALINNVPKEDEEKSRKLAERIALIRRTHYGCYWSFTDDLEHGDTAYTNLFLPLHTDTTYFTDPIKIQMFHLLSFQNGKGGETILSDGFRSAEALKKSDPMAYDALSRIKVKMISKGDPQTIILPYSLAKPILEAELNEQTGNCDLYRLRFNNSDRDDITNMHPSDVKDFYDALFKLQNILEDPQSIYTFSMRPGTAVFIDNWRVLHGRNAFTGKRNLTGCYLNGDDYYSRLRGLRDSQKK